MQRLGYEFLDNLVFGRIGLGAAGSNSANPAYPV
jgi:hypothetical protein